MNPRNWSSLRVRLGACAASLLLTTASAASTVRFIGVGDLPGGSSVSEVRDAIRTPSGILATGGTNTLGPASSQSTDTVFVWTETGGMRALPLLAPTPTVGNPAFGSHFSADGTVVAGRLRYPGTPIRNVGTIHTVAGGAPQLTVPIFSSTQSGGTQSISSNGQIAYGQFTARAIDGTSTIRAYRWSTTEGFTNLGVVAPGYFSTVPASRAVSADGTIFAGNGGNPAGVNVAIRYVHGSGYTVLPGTAADAATYAFAITPDGRTIAGSCAATGVFLRWTDGVLENLDGPALPGSLADFGGISHDGRIIAGSFRQASGSLPFVHNDHGTHDLVAALEAEGVDLTGWSNFFIMGMSGDATLLFGQATHNGAREGFVIDLPAGFLAQLGADLTPPVITSLSVMPSVLWPPNNQMVAVNVSATATDNRDPAPTLQIVDVACNENDTGDWQPTGPLSLQLRAKRAGGNKEGRVYTITVEARDASGNASTATVDVTVPHDRRK